MLDIVCDMCGRRDVAPGDIRVLFVEWRYRDELGALAGTWCGSPSGSTRRPRDFCPDCYAALEAYLTEGLAGE